MSLAKKKYEVSFELGGELQGSFSRAFSSAQQKFKDTDKTAKNLNDRVENSTKKFGGLTSMFHKTSSGASAMTSSLKTAAGALAGLYVVKKGIDVGKTLIEQYQGAFRIIKTGTGAAGKDLDDLMQSYHNLGSVVPDNLKDVASAMSDFNTRTGATGKVLEDLSGKALSLTAIANADLGETIKQSTRMFGDWSVPIEKGGETLDKLYIASQSTGIGVEALAEKMTTFGGPLRQMGFDFETSMAIMGKWEKEGVNAELVLGSLRIALGKMAKAGVKDTNKALNIVIDKVKKAKTTGEATALAMEAFGSKAGPDMAAAIREGRFELGKLADALKTAKGAIDKDFAYTETLDDKIQTIKNKFLVAAEPLGKAAADAIGGVLSTAGTELTSAGNKLNALINTNAWKNADLTGKFSLTWENVISKPLNSWWKESGEKMVYSFGQKTGSMLGKGMWTGFKALLSESGKVFSGGGATSWLSLAILGKTATKAGKTVAPLVSTLGKFVKPATAAATAAGAAAEGTTLMAGAAAALTNPIGWAVLGVGALAGGWYLYKRHQENARQSLIHMGDALKTSLSDYSAVETQTQKTQDLIKEYDRLKTKIADSKTPADELTEAKRKLVEVESTLKDMYPDIISQQDIENDKLREKVGLIDRLTKAQLEEAKLKLEQEIAHKSENKEPLEKEIGKLQSKKESQQSDKEKYQSASVSFKEFENEFQKIMKMDYSEERTKKLEDLKARANEVGESVGRIFNSIDQVMGVSDEMTNKYRDTVDNLVKTTDELSSAEGSYQELYNAQKKMIELDLGGTIEDQAKKYKTMTDAQKQQFDLALQKLSELNREMQLLPTDKKINIDVIQRTTGAFIPNAKVNQALPYADGGMITRPHLGLVGEAGPEAIIPLSSNRRSRALSLYEDVGRSLGIRAYADGGIISGARTAFGGRRAAESVWNGGSGTAQSTAPIVIEHNPSIVIQGSADPSTIKLIEQALRQNKEEFGRMLEAYTRQKGRVSMSGPV